MTTDESSPRRLTAAGADVDEPSRGTATRSHAAAGPDPADHRDRLTRSSLEPQGLCLTTQGAGKSTVLQHVLTADHGLRIAVVLNEFGETGELERKAMSFSGGEGTADPSTELVELANGCWCCTGAFILPGCVSSRSQRLGAQRARAAHDAAR